MNLPDYLSKQGKVYLGTLNSGDNVVIEYTLKAESSFLNVTETTKSIEKNHLNNPSKQTKSASTRSRSKRMTEQSEQSQSASNKFQMMANKILDCLKEKFNQNEDLYELSFRLDIPWDTVKKDIPTNTAIEIIKYCKKKYETEDLAYKTIIEKMKEMRTSGSINRYIMGLNFSNL